MDCHTHDLLHAWHVIEKIDKKQKELHLRREKTMRFIKKILDDEARNEKVYS